MAVLNKIIPPLVLLVFSICVVLPFLIKGDYRSKPPTHAGVGSRFEVRVAPLSSPKRVFVRRDPYSIAIPRPTIVYGQEQTFASTLFSLSKRANTAFDNVVWQDNAEPECSRQNTTFVYTQAQLDRFRYYIENGFRLNFYIDNMPVVSQFGDDLWYGVDIGFVTEGGELFLFTHYDFHIVVDLYGRTMHPVVVPRHTDSTAPCGFEYAQPTRVDSDVVWSYRTFVDTTRNLYEDRWDFYDSHIHGQHSNIEQVGLIWCGVAGFAISVLVGILVYRIAHRKYEVDGFMLNAISTFAGNAVDADSVSDESSSDVFVDIEDTHALLDSSTRQRSHNVEAGASLADTITIDSCGETVQTYLKKASGIILGSPRRAAWLAALNGTGMHLLLVTVVGLIISSMVQRSWDNAWQTVIVLMVPITGWVAGFVANRTIRLYRAKNVLCSLLLMFLCMPCVLMFIFFVVNSIEMQQHDSGIIAALCFFLLFLLVVDFVMMGIGAWFAAKFEPPLLPEKPPIGYLPPFESKCKWITRFVLTTVVYAVVVGISVLWVTMLIVQSIWADRVIMMILVILAFIFFWVWITMGVSILIAYSNVVVSRNPFWHWKTFFTGGGPAVIAFFVGFFYAFTANQDSDFGSQLLIYLIITFVSAMMFVVLGAVSVISVDTFFRRFLYHYVTIK